MEGRAREGNGKGGFSRICLRFEMICTKRHVFRRFTRDQKGMSSFYDLANALYYENIQSDRRSLVSSSQAQGRRGKPVRGVTATPPRIRRHGHAPHLNLTPPCHTCPTITATTNAKIRLFSPVNDIPPPPPLLVSKYRFTIQAT